MARPSRKTGRSSGATTARSLRRDRTDDRTVYEELHATEEFRDLRRRYRSFAFPWAAAFLAWYLLYVLMSMWAGDFMASTIVGHINVALVFGLLQFATTFGLAALYSRHANRQLDPLAEELEGRFNQATGRRGSLHAHGRADRQDAR